jgi:hypothetical protein
MVEFPSRRNTRDGDRKVRGWDNEKGSNVRKKRTYEKTIEIATAIRLNPISLSVTE